MTMRKSRRPAHAGLAAAGVLTGLVLSAAGSAQPEPTNPYWIDHISVCRDPCPSLEFENCRCIKLRPVIVVAE
jgi:hypothetical protein